MTNDIITTLYNVAGIIFLIAILIVIIGSCIVFIKMIIDLFR